MTATEFLGALLVVILFMIVNSIQAAVSCKQEKYALAVWTRRGDRRVLQGALMHLSTANVQGDSLLGLSGDALKRLRQVVSEMLVQAEGDRRAQLEALDNRLSTVIHETERDGTKAIT